MRKTCLYSGRVDFKLAEDCKCFLIELTADGDVGNVWRVVVIKTVDILHHTRPIRFYCRQNQQVLKIPDIIQTTTVKNMSTSDSQPVISCQKDSYRLTKEPSSGLIPVFTHSVYV